MRIILRETGGEAISHSLWVFDFRPIPRSPWSPIHVVPASTRRETIDFVVESAAKNTEQREEWRRWEGEAR